MDKQIFSGIVFYSVCYVLLSLIFGIIIEYFFPKFHKTKKTILILFEIILQTITIILAVYIIEIITNKIKSVGNLKISNYGGSQILGLVFIATQSNYIKKLKKLEYRIIQSI